MKASAVANSNIALAKYWGKRDAKLMLPHNSSISMTLDGLFSHTTCEFDGKYRSHIVILDGAELPEGDAKQEVTIQLDVIKEMAKIKEFAKVVSNNTFPTAAGLASSASGLAALALAGSKAAGLELGKKELSILARRGSGSASRSVYGGFVEWQKGVKSDGSDSHAVQIADENYWKDFRMVVCIASKKEKKIKSRAGMAQSVATSPFYKSWIESVESDIDALKKGILKKDLEAVGSTAEHNCLKMYATMISTKPPIIYWNPASMSVIHSVLELRDNGMKCYFTCDAGPQVKIICLEKDSKEIAEMAARIEGVEDVIVSGPGRGAEFVKRDLF
ncbi:MAG: diphosphomevalonate decarboxylase [Candidatus Aenigmarchaeota archaeon]|nr:diphosphomevalonate decarboxylase [Candidatus Aenigmarchaeota archaeon]